MINRAKYIVIGLWLTLFSQALMAQGQTHRDIMSMMMPYRFIDTAHLELDAALEDHEKLFHFTRNYGSFIVEQIQKKQPLTGPQLNLIHVAFGQFLKLSEMINDYLVLTRYTTNNSIAPIYARIVLAERFKTLHSVYFSETLLRRIVKDKMLFEKYELYRIEKLASILLSNDRQKSAEDLITLLLNGFKTTPDIYLPKLMATTSYKLVSEGSDLSSIYSTKTYWTDRFASVNTGITRTLSWAFGATAGNIEWRDGYLYKRPAFYEETRKNLKPLDLIFEKRTFKLTDYTIPGNWGHMAVWLGTKEELIELGIWDHPALDFFREQILQGNSIYEVRRWGLVFESLENMLNLDETATLRVRDILKKDSDDLAEIYARLADQKDKTYDFSFNALATDRVTCTEIVFLSYGNINWPSEKILGRTSIKPDNMAELVLYDNSPLEFVSYTTAYSPNELNKKTKDEFADILGYVTRTERNGKKYYEKKGRHCVRQYYRVSGKMRIRTACTDTFERRSYTEVDEFLSPLQN